MLKLRASRSFGLISTMSFYPNKHVTTGEGGMVLTDDPDLAERCRRLRNLCFDPNGRSDREPEGIIVMPDKRPLRHSASLVFYPLVLAPSVLVAFNRSGAVTSVDKHLIYKVKLETSVW